MIRIIFAALLSCISINALFADQIVVLNKHFNHTAEGGNDKYMGFCLFQPSINMPKNLVDPIDYSNGTVYFRLKVNNKPSNKPAWYNFGFQQGNRTFAEHFCDRIEITTTKTYEWNQPLSTWWKPNDPKLHVDYTKPINRLMAVLWDKNPNPNRQLDDRWGYGDWLTPDIIKSYFPMDVHLQVVLVSNEGKFEGFPEIEPAFPKFSIHTIDKIGSKMGQTSLVDVDNDGDLDWVTGNADHAGSSIWWWEYQSPDRWIRHNLGKGKTDVGGSCYDINQDGWIDVACGSKMLINTGDPRNEPFKEYNTVAIYSHDTEFADVNNDGKTDVIANSDRTGLYWYDISTDLTKPWISYKIASATEHKIHGGVSPNAVGDLDGDGDNDVATGQAWYENLDGAGTSWKQRANIDFGEKHQYGIALKTWVIDMDRDGDNDFVQAEADNPDSRVAWFENDGKGSWTRHIVKDKGDRQDFHSLVVADFDGDGDPDIFSGGGPLSEKGAHKCYIWENTAIKNEIPTSDKWKEHIVANKPCHEAVGADVDRDGDIDICTKPWSTGNEHIYIQNLLIP